MESMVIMIALSHDVNCEGKLSYLTMFSLAAVCGCLFWRGRCEGHARFVLLAAFDYGGFLLLGAVYLLWKMRNVRKQVRISSSLTLQTRTRLVSLGSLDVPDTFDVTFPAATARLKSYE